MTESKNRWDEIRKVQIESGSAYHILGAVLLVLFGVWLGSRLFNGDSGYGSNLFAELLGIFVTVFIIDYLNRQREERRRKRELKDRLLREANSLEPEISRYAFYEMRDLNLIFGENSILQGENLWSTKPENVDLSGANMKGTGLCNADLSNAFLIDANLENANFRIAKLKNASLGMARLVNAELGNADLSNAELLGTDLTGANLRLAKVRNAYLVFRPPNTSEIRAGPNLSGLPETSFCQMAL
ncbi:MAG: pentapeptide repeat-containing protein [Anaerolineaceae bacterium]|nr:pentapeptide repeat-containing protein [Anaerolineaceae bacterium]